MCYGSRPRWEDLRVMTSRTPRTGYCAPALRPPPPPAPRVPRRPPLEAAPNLEMQLRVVLGSILSVAIVGCGVLLANISNVPAKSQAAMGPRSVLLAVEQPQQPQEQPALPTAAPATPAT